MMPCSFYTFSTLPMVFAASFCAAVTWAYTPIGIRFAEQLWPARGEDRSKRALSVLKNAQTGQPKLTRLEERHEDRRYLFSSVRAIARNQFSPSPTADRSVSLVSFTFNFRTAIVIRIKGTKKNN